MSEERSKAAGSCSHVLLSRVCMAFLGLEDLIDLDSNLIGIACFGRRHGAIACDSWSVRCSILPCHGRSLQQRSRNKLRPVGWAPQAPPGSPELDHVGSHMRLEFCT